MSNFTETNWFARTRRERAARALERQLDYQYEKAQFLKAVEQQTAEDLARRTAETRRMLENFRAIGDEDRVLEVGSGAHGLIFEFGARFAVGVDPLAVHYKRLFPRWQQKAQTIAAAGERLPFADNAFDVVLCDNVIDHAEQPFAIVDELVRVLRPAGLLYFTVNVHHPIYAASAKLHNFWNAIGLRYEITPFADHTIHCTIKQMRGVFDCLPLRVLHAGDTIAEIKQRAKTQSARNLEQNFKRLFYKNAKFEIVAVRE